MASDNLAPNNLASGQFGTKIVKTDNLALQFFGIIFSEIKVLISIIKSYYSPELPLSSGVGH